MRRAGRHVEDDVLAHSENINFFGAIEVDIEASSPSSARPDTGRCACATPRSETKGSSFRAAVIPPRV
jgi:hypothetical protein